MDQDSYKRTHFIKLRKINLHFVKKKEKKENTQYITNIINHVFNSKFIQNLLMYIIFWT